MKRFQILDPRPAEIAMARPFVDTVNIPWETLRRRTHELAAPGAAVPIAACDEAAHAVDWLETHGRTTQVVEVPYGPTERGRLWEPNPWVAEVAAQLTPGVAVDIGCGAGRDAVYLASLGWRVVAIDLLPDAILRGRDLASRYLDEPDRIHWEVQHVGHLPVRGQFDLMLQILYLHRPLLQNAAEVVLPGGAVIVETFSARHREMTGHPRNRDLALGVDEVGTLLTGFEIRHAAEVVRADRSLTRVWAQRGLDAGPRP